MDKTLVRTISGNFLEVSFGTVVSVPRPLRGRGFHRNATARVRIDPGHEEVSMYLRDGYQIRPNGQVPTFVDLSIRRLSIGDEVCIGRSSKGTVEAWGLKKFYMQALEAPTDNGIFPDTSQVEESEEVREMRRLERQWQEMTPEEVSLLAAGRNTGANHRGKFSAYHQRGFR